MTGVVVVLTAAGQNGRVVIGAYGPFPDRESAQRWADEKNAAQASEGLHGEPVPLYGVVPDPREPRRGPRAAADESGYVRPTLTRLGKVRT